MKRIAQSVLVAATIGIALLGTAGTAAATEAPYLPHWFPTSEACMTELERIESIEGIPGKYGCYPVDPSNYAGPANLDYNHR
ncbi:hypothetical protein ACWCPQ_32115 [Nocardia sp. NPDC001965]